MPVKKPRKKSSPPEDGARIIKKYPNRRLYDMTKRAYITLNDIKNYVLERIDFRVVDAQSGADLTKATLFQVLTEHETAANTFFTTELLQQMIRLYHENMQNIFSQYFEQTLSQFIQQKEHWSKSFEKLPGDWTRMQSQLWEALISKTLKK